MRPPRREVRAAYVLHEVFDGGVRVLDEVDDRVIHLGEIVRRDVGRHADGDAERAVEEDVRARRRARLRLFLGAVVVGAPVDRVLVEVAEQLAAMRDILASV
jgi:hypothetical protein